MDDPEKDENWYIGDGSVDVEKGDRVRISFDTNKGSITEIDVIGGDSEDGASRGSDSGKESSPMGENAADPSNLTPKDTRIMVQTAFKEACETVRNRQDGEDLAQGKHLEAVSEFTNGYFNLMKAQVNDKTGGGE